MPMRFWLGVAAAATLCVACASQPNGLATLPPTRIAVIAWTEFAGLSQDDLRERVGMPRTGETLASAARIENGDVYSEVWAVHFLRGACSAAPRGYTSRAEVSHNNASLELLNRRITRMHAPKLPAGPPPDAENPFIVSCHFSRSTNLGDTLNSGQTIGLLPLLPVFLLSKGIGDAKALSRYNAYSELRLGEHPPGGYDAWIRRHADHFVASANGPENELRFNTPDGKDKHRPPAARLRDGRVVSLNAGVLCTLRADNSLTC